MFDEVQETSAVLNAAPVPEKEQSVGASPAGSAPVQRHLVSMGNSAETLRAAESIPNEGNSEVVHGLPRIQPFELPVASLAQMAEGSGLQWVNSNAERVAQVQAAIASEPVAIHVPRERVPVAVVDEGPLVLVETKRDLTNTVLPFERLSHAEDTAQR